MTYKLRNIITGARFYNENLRAYKDIIIDLIKKDDNRYIVKCFDNKYFVKECVMKINKYIYSLTFLNFLDRKMAHLRYLLNRLLPNPLQYSRLRAEDLIRVFPDKALQLAGG